jgi:hypothetical protein
MDDTNNMIDRIVDEVPLEHEKLSAAIVRRLDTKVKHSPASTEPYCHLNFVLDTNLWTRVDRGEHCRAEMCTLRNNESLVARRRHYHARCEHRHSSGLKSGMRFHHHQMEKIRKHQSAHVAEENRNNGCLLQLSASVYATIHEAGLESHEPGVWTGDATRKLSALVGDHPGRSSLPWNEIPLALSTAYPGFNVSPQQCLLHWRIVVNENKTVTGVRTWSDIEDDRLSILVGLFGPKWSLITQMLPGREPKQCRERYLNVVESSKSRKAWTSAEDTLLIHVHNRNCNRFAQTAKFFPCRSYKEVRDRWHQIRRSDKYFIKKPVEYMMTSPKPSPVSQICDDIHTAPADTVRTSKIEKRENKNNEDEFLPKKIKKNDFQSGSNFGKVDVTSILSLKDNEGEEVVALSLLGLRYIRDLERSQSAV